MAGEDGRKQYSQAGDDNEAQGAVAGDAEGAVGLKDAHVHCHDGGFGKGHGGDVEDFSYVDCVGFSFSALRDLGLKGNHHKPLTEP